MTYTARLWIVIFAEPTGPAWWARFLRPGFRHCYAVSWYADQERWVEFNPARPGTSIHLWKAEEFPARLTQMFGEATAILRVASRAERGNAPALAFCTGELKALLGIRSFALTPYALYGDLIARGAEVVQAPCVVAKPEGAAPSAA